MRKKWKKILAMVLICGGCLTACGTGGQEDHSVVATTNTASPKESKATGTPQISQLNKDKQKDNKDNKDNKNNKDNKGKDDPAKLNNIQLSVARWDTATVQFFIEALRFGTGGGAVTDFGRDWQFLARDENLSTVVKKNPKYFVEFLEYTDDEHKKHKAARYFKDNNSYILYEKDVKGKKHNYLCLVNQMCTLEYPLYTSETMENIAFPYPCFKTLDNWEMEKAWENNENLLEKEFWLYSYKELKKFYQNFEKNTAVCSDKNQTIQVKALSYDYNNKTCDVRIKIDCKHKDFVVKDSQGKKIFEQADILNAFEKQYKSAGKVGQKEFLYDFSGDLLCVEKGKKTHCIDDDTLDDLYAEDGFNCVGKSLEMKVSPKSNSKKVYIDVTLYLEEEGDEWEVQTTLLLNSKGRFVKRIKG